MAKKKRKDVKAKIDKFGEEFGSIDPRPTQYIEEKDELAKEKEKKEDFKRLREEKKRQRPHLQKHYVKAKNLEKKGLLTEPFEPDIIQEKIAEDQPEITIDEEDLELVEKVEKELKYEIGKTDL